MKKLIELPTGFIFGEYNLIGYSSDRKMYDILRNGIIQPIFYIENCYNGNHYFIIYVDPNEVEKLETELNIFISEDDSGWFFIESDIQKAFDFRLKFGWNCEELDYKQV